MNITCILVSLAISVAIDKQNARKAKRFFSSNYWLISSAGSLLASKMFTLGKTLQLSDDHHTRWPFCKLWEHRFSVPELVFPTSSPPGWMMKYFNKLRRLICCSSNSSSFSTILLCIKSANIPTTNENKIKLVWTTKEKFEHHPRVIKRLNYPVSPLFGHKTARRLKVNYKVTLFLTSSVGSLSFNCLKTSPCFFISCWISVLENEVSLDAILHCWSAACKTAQNPEDSEVYLFG